MLARLKIVFTLAIRYYSAGLGGSSGRRYVRFVNRASVIGMMLGTASLIVVVSVMNGFDRELKDRMLSLTPHILIGPVANSRKLLQVGSVVSLHPFLAADGLLLEGQAGDLIGIQGLSNDDPQVSMLIGALTNGRWWEKGDAIPILVGETLARRNGLQLGEMIKVAIIQVNSATNQIEPKVAAFRLQGTFKTGSELDTRIALVRVSDLAIMLRKEPLLRLRLSDPMDVGSVTALLVEKGFLIHSAWDQEFGAFFKAVKLEKLLMGLLLSVLVGLALISLSAGMRIVILEKQQVTEILITLGLSIGECRQIFIIQGLLLTATGITLGLFAGLVGASQLPTLMNYLELMTGFSVVAGSYFSELPVDIRSVDTAFITLVSFISAVIVLVRLVLSSVDRPRQAAGQR